MFQIGKTIVSEDIIEKDFVCNLSACKGACCVEGDAGAPLDEEEIKIFDLQIEDEDSDTLSVSFDYNKSNFELLYDNSSSQLTLKYVGSDITETTRKQFDIIVSDNYNEVVKTVYVTIYPENESPVIAFDSDIVISEGGKKYYKVDINDDNIGKVTYQFNTEINGLNFS